MSHPYNTLWIESAYENFGQALLEGDIHLAKDIIADTFDAGFAIEARAMANELRRVETNKLLTNNQVWLIRFFTS